MLAESDPLRLQRFADSSLAKVKRLAIASVSSVPWRGV
jgi:hypothetical protein